MHEQPHCEECSEELFELDGEFYCPHCDSVSGFELRPGREEFRV